MDEAEGNDREAIRKPRVPTSTFALSHAMLAAGAMSAVDSFGAILGSFTGFIPRSSSAPCVFSFEAPVTAGVNADIMLGTICGLHYELRLAVLPVLRQGRCQLLALQVRPHEC